MLQTQSRRSSSWSGPTSPQKLAAGVDLGALKGAGTDAAGRHHGTAGVSTATGLADYEDVVNVVAQVEAANVPMASLGWAGNAFVKARLMTTLRTTRRHRPATSSWSEDSTLGGYPYRP